MRTDRAIAVGVALFGVTVVACFWWAFLMVPLWTWYITPVFHIEAPAIPIIAGLFVVGDMIEAKYTDEVEFTTWHDVTRRLVWLTIAPLLFWLTGATIHLFVR